MVGWINDLYREAWEPYHNFFRPCMKLVSKKRVGSRYQKRYDQPQTPYDRLVAYGGLSDSQLESLHKQKAQLDPLELKKEIEERLSGIWKKLDEVA